MDIADAKILMRNLISDLWNSPYAGAVDMVLNHLDEVEAENARLKDALARIQLAHEVEESGEVSLMDEVLEGDAD